MAESNDKGESLKRERRKAQKLIAAGVAIGIWFVTVVLFVNLGGMPKGSGAQWLMISVAAIPAIAGATIVTGLLRYFDTSN